MTSFSRQLGFIYLFAFSSLYVQWPGLYSENGVLPVADFTDRYKTSELSIAEAGRFYLKFPSLVLFHGSLGVTADGLCEFILLVGIFCSVLASLGKNNHFLFGSLWACYLSLVLSGQTFMSFQWDILLLEVGALSVLLAPLSTTQPGYDMDWCYRFIAFKLMVTRKRHMK